MRTGLGKAADLGHGSHLIVAGRGGFPRTMMVFARFTTFALFAACSAAALGTAARAEPLDRAVCKTLKAEQKSLLTRELKAALARGPDWVKENLHSSDQIEKVRQYLLVEEKAAFRCRTDGVRIPKPRPMELPDRKPEPPTEIAEAEQVKVVAAANSLMPLRNPDRPALAEGDAEPPQEAGDAGDITTSIDPDQRP
jgi:hypothetical protein